MDKIFYLFLIYGYSYGWALPQEEKDKIMTAMMPHVQECSKERGVSVDEINVAKGTAKLTELDSCLMGCIYKKIHVIDDKGFFDLEKSAEIYKKYFASESDRKYISELMNTCASVNKETVSDGDKGCDRGRLLNDCLMPFQDQFFSMR